LTTILGLVTIVTDLSTSVLTACGRVHVLIYNKRLQDVSRETENMTLGDSGFYSPRVTEYELDKNKNKMKMPLYKNLTYDHHELNNLRDFQKEKIVIYHNCNFSLTLKFKQYFFSTSYRILSLIV
jgi:hypothetical protein